MKENKRKKVSIQSNSGFTMADLAISIIVFTIFIGTIGSLFYSIYKINLQTKMTAAAMNYATEILEDIDKISYDKVVNGMENEYITKFSIPSAYQLNLEVRNYNEGNDREDLIKKVKLTVSYQLAGDPETLMIQKLKIKE